LEEWRKKVVQLLRSGATLLSESCPECNVPLIKIKDEVFCPKCGKKIVFVKNESQAISALDNAVLPKINQIILEKTQIISDQIKNANDTRDLIDMGRLLLIWLEALEKIKKISS